MFQFILRSLNRFADYLYFRLVIAHAHRQFRRTDAAPCQFLEHILGNAVFQRMEGNDGNAPAGLQMGHRRAEGILQYPQLVIDLNADGLENPFGRVSSRRLPHRLGLYGSTQNNPRSRFLKECEEKIQPTRIPPARPSYGYAEERRIEEPKRDLSAILRNVNGAAADLSKVKAGEIGFKLGEKVVHPRYGVGRIIQISGDNASVAFDGLGIKQFNMKIAPFKKG